MPDVAILTALALLGAVVMLAALLKLSDPAWFSQIVREFRIVPPPLARPAAVVVAWTEMIVGAGLLAGIGTGQFA